MLLGGKQPHQIDDALVPVYTAQGTEVGLVFAGQHENVALCDQFFRRGTEQLGDVRNLFLDIDLVRSHQLGQRDVVIVDADLEAFADHRFYEINDRAFAQVVGAFFEGQSEKSERTAFEGHQ